MGFAKIDIPADTIAEFCRTYIGVDPAEAPMPVQPTAHYGMGGIPTDVQGRVPAKGSKVLGVPVRISYAELISAVKDARPGGNSFEAKA